MAIWRHPGLGVSHLCRRIIDRPEVALRLDQRVPLREVLAETHQRVVDGVVGVRMEPTHDVADNTGALTERSPRADTGVVHRKENAPVYRLQAIAHIREGARAQ